MNAMLASMLRGIGIDPDRPELFIDKLLATFGVSAAEIKQFVIALQAKLADFDLRLSATATQAQIEELKGEIALLRSQLESEDC